MRMQTPKDANVKKKKDALSRSFATSPQRIFPQINSMSQGAFIPPNQCYPPNISSGNTMASYPSGQPFCNSGIGASGSGGIGGINSGISNNPSTLESTPLQSFSSSRFFELLNALKLEYECMQRELIHQQLSIQKQNTPTSNSSSDVNLNNLMKEVSGIQNYVIELEHRYQQALLSHKEELKSLQTKIYNQIICGDSSKDIPSILKIDITTKPPSLDHVENILSGKMTATIDDSIPIKSPIAMLSKRPPPLDHQYSLDERKKMTTINVNTNTNSNTNTNVNTNTNSNVNINANATIDTSSNPEGIKSFLDWLVIYNDNLKKQIFIELILTIPIESIVSSIKFSPDGSILALGTNNQVCLYSTKGDNGAGNLLLLNKLGDSNNNSNTEFYYRALCFNKSGSILATGSEDKVIRLWDPINFKLIKRLEGHSKEIYGLVFDNHDILYSAGGDRIIMKWNCQNLDDIKCVQVFKEETNLKMEKESSGEIGFSSIVITNNDATLISGTLDNKIIIWDTKSGNIIQEILGHSDSVYSLTLSHDDQHLFSSSLDHTIKMWKLDNHDHDHHDNHDNNNNGDVDGDDNSNLSITPIQTMTGHKDYVLTISSISSLSLSSFSKNNNNNNNNNNKEWVISGGKDSTINIWNVYSDHSTLELTLKGHSNSVISISSTVLYDGQILFASASGDGRARIWTIKSLK